MATIGRAGMSTTGGRTNEGPFHIRKNSKHPRLVQLSKLAEDAGSFRFPQPALPKEPGFDGPASPKGKLEQKYGRRQTQKWVCEG